jgi:hypothetical protein
MLSAAQLRVFLRALFTVDLHALMTLPNSSTLVMAQIPPERHGDYILTIAKKTFGT